MKGSRREGTTLLIDLHCHTRPLSACSSLSIEELIDGAQRAGLNGLCLTEHDRLWPAEELQALSERHGIVLLRGMEVTTELGHVLVFGLEEVPFGIFLAQALRRAVEAADGLMVLAHPARSGQPSVDSASLARLFDMVEVLNGSDGPEQNRAAGSLAGRCRLPGTGGSDCHSLAEIGRVATRLAMPVTSERELVEELRRGRHQAVWLSESGKGG